MNALPSKNRVAFSVTNCICFDQRVIKMAEALNQLNYSIVIIGRRREHSCDLISLPFRTRRFRMIFKRGFLFYGFFNIRLFFHLVFHRYNLLVANDLDTLLPSYLVSRLMHVPLVYDSHEYFTGVPEIQERPFVKWVWTAIERSIFPHLEYVLTVGDRIAEKYHGLYGIRPVTVRNCARSASSMKGYTRRELNVNDGDLLLILQGTGINADRGGEELMDAIAGAENVILLIVGSGDLIPAMKMKALSLKITDKVRFIPAVPWNEMMRYAKSADAGLSLDKETNENHLFSLPNKLFDYISAGIPVIAGSLPEVNGIIAEYNCGIIIRPVSSDSIKKAVITLRDDRRLLEELKRNSEKAFLSLNWEKESEKVLDLYKSLIN
ncbi:MAG: glycosyltransferase [Bacteroidales bacterium]|jgi:glycosyltransferase involved in cell wall biosynthesis